MHLRDLIRRLATDAFPHLDATLLDQVFISLAQTDAKNDPKRIDS